MNGHKLRDLMEKFHRHYEDCDYAGYMSRRDDLPTDEKEEWQDEEDYHEYVLWDIRYQIEKADISYYMNKKYGEEIKEILHHM
jgi:hypothetical protein